MQAMPIEQNQTASRVLLGFNADSIDKDWPGRVGRDECGRRWDKRRQSRDESILLKILRTFGQF